MRAVTLALGLLLFFAMVAVLLGYKPRPCPRHICLPRSEIVTAEQLLAQRRAEAEAGKREAP